jgi:hypothetical protein
MSTENPIGLPIPVGVIAPDDRPTKTKVTPVEQDYNVASSAFISVESLWLTMLKMGVATTVAMAAPSLNPFFVLSVFPSGKSPA